ncbi:MAG: hypothetical protein JNL60_13805, partial [Bacteroidia bacterium]|nr:hypothetical protein [Bacteroidia bacterium]
MKRILLIGYIMRIISVNGQIDPGPYYVPGGYNLTSGTDTKIHNSIVAGVGGYNASANGQAIVEGLNYAAAMPGYAASGFINNGYATLRINGNLPRIASFHANGFAAIPKYDRFEIGIHLPSSIQSQIDSYISTGINAQGRINPYDPDQIKIECVFSLQGATPAVQHKRHGFYESQVVTGVDYAANDVWITSGTPHEYPFRIRFAPTATGVWTGTVKIYQNNTLTYSLNDFDFTVVASTNPGHLGIKNTGANGIQKFQFVDNNVVFYGLGRNIACAGYDNGSRAYSPTVDANLNENPCLERPYYESKAKPTAHREQRYYIRNLAHNGANFVRIRFDRTSVPIEETPICNQIPSSGTLVGYPYNPSSTDLTNFSRNERQMWEMDSTLRTCEINKMYILLTLLDDHDFSLQAQYETDQNGNVLVDSSGNPIRIQVVGWNGNPYKPMVSSRDDFFTDPNCIAIFKKRLYYIEARWGYSTQIAAWEMFNETENMDKNGWNQTLRLKIGAWLCEMKSYLQSADISPHHPFSNASVYQPWSGPVSVNVQPSQNNCLDFNIEHMYSGEAMNCSTGGRYHPSTPALQDLNTAYTKPHMVSEFGVLPYASVVRDGPMTFHTQNWGSIFANDLTVALQWAWWYSGTPATVNPYHIQYQALRAFIDRVNFNTQLIMGRNVPCGNTNCSGCSLPVETYWLKTALSDTIYGWSKNITANFMTDG